MVLSTGKSVCWLDKDRLFNQGGIFCSFSEDLLSNQEEISCSFKKRSFVHLRRDLLFAHERKQMVQLIHVEKISA